MTTKTIAFTVLAASVAAFTTTAVAEVKNPVKKPAVTQATPKAHKNAVSTRNTLASNWPELPERQAGKPYRKIIESPFGARERNFESGH